MDEETRSQIDTLKRWIDALRSAEGFYPGAEGFRIGSTRLLEKLVSPTGHDSEYHLHQRDEDGTESDLTGARSIQGIPVSETEPTTTQILGYNATTNEYEPTAAGAAAAHKDAHDPQDGADPLDCAAAGTISPDAGAAEGSAHSFARSDHAHANACAAASSIAGVQAAGEGAAGSFARSDHAHGIAHSIADNALVTVDDAGAADDEYARFTASGLEGRVVGDVRTDINVADGADVTGDNAPQAHHDSHDPQDGSDALDCAAPSELAGVQATGEGSAHEFARADHAHQVQASIADDHLVTIDDADAADDDYCKLTAAGIEGREASEVRSDINVADGADVTGDNTPKAHGPAQHTEGNTWKMVYQDAAGDETEIAVGADGTVLTGQGAAAAPAFQAASEHAHANDHAQAHGPSDHTSFANWKVIYTDASGDQQEVAVGADGTVFTGTGAASAPAFEAADEHAHANDHAEVHGIAAHTEHANWKALYTDGSGDEQEIALGADGEVFTSTGAAGVPAFEAAAGGTGDEIVDADNDTKIQVEESADEDKIRMDVAGTERYLMDAASPHHLLTGDVHATGHVGLGIAPEAVSQLYVGGTITLAGGAQAANYGVTVETSGAGAGTRGVFGNIQHKASGAGSMCRGLEFSVYPWKIESGSFLSVDAIYLSAVTLYAPTITNLNYIYLAPATAAVGAPTIGTLTAINVTDLPGSLGANPTTCYGLKISEFSLGTTRYLMEIGLVNSVPKMRVSGNWSATANETPLYLAYGTPGTLGQVQYKDFDDLSSGDKVMLLV